MAQQVRTGLDVKNVKQDLLDNLFYVQGKFPEVATRNDWYAATAYTVRDRMLSQWVKSAHSYYESKARTVCYFSAEFLIGPQLGINLLCLDAYEPFKKALAELGQDLNELVDHEEEPGLGNGGLGRLAACYMESMAALEVPAIGYGIRYEFGIFDQEIRNGWQAEVADSWLNLGNPWEIPRPEIRFEVKFGGHTEGYRDSHNRYRVRWTPQHLVLGTPYDTAVLGYGVPTANLLRLWKAQADISFDFQAFNHGDYYGAVHDKVDDENITKVLYPNDEPLQGRELRLKQQYFFVSCSLQDMIRLHLQREDTLDGFHLKYAVQLNDTHPSLAIPELMRLLIDEHLMDWDEAWEITSKTFAYTNHTLLPEALERWPVGLVGRVLPRILEIIYEINHRFLAQIRAQYPDNEKLIRQLSLIDESGERYICMANLACIGSHAINGVAELHTKLLEEKVMPDFHFVMPKKFSNKTNGVSPRRFVLLANPGLSELITEAIGDKWLKDLEDLQKLESLAADSAFKARWRKVKTDNKKRLSRLTADLTGVVVDHTTLFDIHVKRMHEYKRQHLNMLHVITLYNRLKKNPDLQMTPRTVLFGGKAAPGYFLAKLIIKLINSIAELIEHDPVIRGRLKVAFIPDFNLQKAQFIYPAADLSEQISTAGKEASGTGNMKMAMNGALTIGTLDGANIEIRDAVGEDNFFLFGLTAAQVEELWRRGYNPRAIYESNAELNEAIRLIGANDLFHPIVDSLLNRDAFSALADYQSYIECQDRAAAAFADEKRWTEMSILNTARMGRFSSDRAIREYCRDIWDIPVATTDAARATAP